MEKEFCLINEIRSYYILDNLFDFIKDKNYRIKIFLYSKHFQENLPKYNEFVLKYLLKCYKDNINKYLYCQPQSNYLENDGKHYLNFLKDNDLNKKKVEKAVYYKP